MSKGLGSMQTRLLDALLDRQDDEDEFARWLVRAGYGEVMELLDEGGWQPVAALVGPTHSEQESARRAVQRLAQQGYVELRLDWRGKPRRRVLLVRLRG